MAQEINHEEEAAKEQAEMMRLLEEQLRQAEAEAAARTSPDSMHWQPPAK
jgi:hypothetical protein